MSALLLERQHEAVAFADKWRPTKRDIRFAGRLAVASQFGPTDSGKGYHGPRAVREVERRIANGHLPKALRERGVYRCAHIRSHVDRRIRPEEERQSEEERPYERYYNLEDETDWTDFQGLLASNGLCQVVTAPGGRVYTTLKRSYDRQALNLVELTAAESLKLRRAKYFGAFSTTLLFAKRFDYWFENVVERDGVNPEHFPARLIEGWDGMNTVREENEDMRAILAANDYGRDGDVPAWMQLANGWLHFDSQEEVDHQEENQGYFDTYYQLYGEFMLDYLENPRPLDQFVGRYL